MSRPEKIKRAYPYSLLPDGVWAAMGATILACFVVPTMMFIGGPLLGGEILFFLMGKIVPWLTIKNIEKQLEKWASKVLVDPRNCSYLFPIFVVSTYTPLLFCFMAHRYLTHGFEWSALLLYHCMRTGPRYRLFTWAHVLVHKEGHDHVGFFKGPWSVLNHICNWWAGLFYGVVPNSYGISHNKIHHAYSNGLLDVHTNWDLDRTKPYSFLLYIPRFAGYWMSISPIWYFYKGVEKTERRFLRGLIFGVLYHVAAAAIVAYMVDLRFMFLYFLLPMPEAIVFLGGVSYIWHAFIDPNDYDNYYVSSMTIVNGRENMWNEDYHVEHHFAPHLHWTEFPEHYRKNEQHFRQKKATIFTDTEEGELFFLLITKSWEKMAAKFVDLSNTMTLQEKKELLIHRLSHTVEVSA